MTNHTVRTAEELEAAFAAAQDGDKIELAPGNYEGFRLWLRDFDGAGVTITSADPNNRAVLTDEISIRETTGVTLTGIDFTANRVADSMSESWISAHSNSGLTISDMVITGYLPNANEGADPLGAETSRTEPIAGYGFGLGLQVKQGSDVVISDIEFRDLRGALKVGKIAGLEVSDLDIHDVREGINLFDVQDTVIENSRFYDFKPWKTDGPQGDDHPDMIQYWGVNSEIGIHNLTIRNNMFYQSADDLGTQTIFGVMTGAAEGVTATNWVISGNTIINDKINGLAIYGVDGLQITDNLMLPNRFDPEDPADAGLFYTPRLILRDARDVLVANNTILPIGQGIPVSVDVDSTATGTINVTNNLLLSEDPDDPLYWKPYAAAVVRPTVPEDTGDDAPPPLPPSDPDPDDTPDPAPEPDPDGPTGPGGADLSGMNADDLARYAAEGAKIMIGTNGIDLLRGQDSDSFFFGLHGDDSFKEQQGNDVMHGGDGGDRFVIDLRGGGPQSRDLILDLDFGEGDTLMVTTAIDGYFTDETDPLNDIQVLSGGATASFDSLADLAEMVASGVMTATQAADGEGLSLVFDAAPGRVIELAGYAPEDLGLDAPPPLPPSDPDPDDTPDPAPEPDPDDAPDPDGPTGPGGADLSGMNADDLARYAAEGAKIMIGTNGIDLLRGQDSDSFFFGLHGDDSFKEQQGNDVMHGGDGGDRFVIDLRGGGPQSRDLILDLDFGEGDTLMVTTAIDGYFTDETDPLNDIQVLSGGATASFDSLADLAEMVASGVMTATQAADGEGLSLVFDAAPGRVIELAGYAPEDLGLDAPLPLPPSDPDPDDTPDPAPEPDPDDAPDPDGPTGPGGADLSGMNADDLARYAAEGAKIMIGTNGIDLLRGQDSDSFFFGLHGDDSFKEQQGNDVMHGGDGGDRFVIDLRGGGPQSRDLILDLDFGEGDTLMVTTAIDGYFTDETDPLNDIQVLSGGATASFDSLADLAEMVASGVMTATQAADGEGLSLVFDAAPGRVIELAGYAPEDLLA